jgi:hypothetical protein
MRCSWRPVTRRTGIWVEIGWWHGECIGVERRQQEQGAGMPTPRKNARPLWSGVLLLGHTNSPPWICGGGRPNGRRRAFE